MKIICPYDSTHKKFLAVAHVAEEWVIDDKGNFLECVKTVETTHKPSYGDRFVCLDCEEETEAFSTR